MRYLSLIICLTLAGTSYAEDKFYGLLTTDSFPLKNCAIIDAEPLFMSTQSITNLPPEYVSMRMVGLEGYIEEEVKRKGFNALLGYKLTFIGGAYEGAYEHKGITYTKQPVVTGLVVANGVMAKIKCK